MPDSVLSALPYNVEKSELMMPFWEGLNSKKFKTTKCEKCATIHFPPSPTLCPHCFGMSMRWIELPLSGKVQTFTHVTAPPEGFTGDYVLASVIVDELNKPILARFVGDGLQIDDIVSIDFEDVAGQSLIIFKKA